MELFKNKRMEIIPDLAKFMRVSVSTVMGWLYNEDKQPDKHRLYYLIDFVKQSDYFTDLEKATIVVEIRKIIANYQSNKGKYIRKPLREAWKYERKEDKNEKRANKKVYVLR